MSDEPDVKVLLENYQKAKAKVKILISTTLAAILVVLLFWIIYSLVIGPVPAISEITLFRLHFHLPFGLSISRWWDIILGIFIGSLLSQLYLSIKAVKDERKEKQKIVAEKELRSRDLLTSVNELEEEQKAVVKEEPRSRYSLIVTIVMLVLACFMTAIFIGPVIGGVFLAHGLTILYLQGRTELKILNSGLGLVYLSFGLIYGLPYYLVFMLIGLSSLLLTTVTMLLWVWTESFVSTRIIMARLKKHSHLVKFTFTENNVSVDVVDDSSNKKTKKNH